jgi:putative flavoprotein involved in K+ transport
VEPESHQALIVGAGAAGLAAAATLRRRGIDALVLDRADRIASSWRGRYDGLRLNTDRWMARLPCSPPPRRRWPGRDEFVSYLETYRERNRIAVRFGVEVTGLERGGSGWLLRTDNSVLTAPFVVIATGRDHQPVLPDWPGVAGFSGELLHAARYLRPEPFEGRDVLVVGAGNSATEIALQLSRAGAARVRMAVRTPPNLVSDHIFGVPSTLWARMFEILPPVLLDPVGRWITSTFVGDLSESGLGSAPLGIGSELPAVGRGPVVDRGFSAALRRGEIEVVPAVTGFDGARVHLAGRPPICPHVVIAATGYRYGLEDLVGALGVLDESGAPTMRDGECHAEAPGLFFNGYRLALTGELPEMRRNARRIARTIARELDASP